VHGEAGCMLCCQARGLEAVFPVAQGCELKLYKCASCGSTLWLVTRVSKRQTESRSRGAQFTTIDAVLKGLNRVTVTPKLKGPTF